MTSTYQLLLVYRDALLEGRVVEAAAVLAEIDAEVSHVRLNSRVVARRPMTFDDWLDDLFDDYYNDDQLEPSDEDRADYRRYARECVDPPDILKWQRTPHAAFDAILREHYPLDLIVEDPNCPPGRIFAVSRQQFYENVRFEPFSFTVNPVTFATLKLAKKED